MKKDFNKELAIAKQDDGDFENYTKRWIWDNFYLEGDVNSIWNGGSRPPGNVSPVISTNVGIYPQIFLNLNFNPFATLV